MSNTWIVKKLCAVDSERAIRGIALDNNGNIYFTMGLDGLWRLNKDDMKPQCIVKDGSDMSGIVWNGKKCFYVCDEDNRILSYSIDTGTLSTLAGIRTSGHQDGNIKDATFALPWGIAMDRNGDLYITEWDRIRKINIGSGTVETVAGPTGSQNDNGYQDRETKNAKFNRPNGISISNDGTIYVCDRRNCCIRQIKNGVVSTLAGTPGKEGYKDGTLRDSLFSGWIPGLVMTHDGSLLVADRNNGLRTVDTQVSTPQELQVIRYPFSLTTDNEGNIYCGTGTKSRELWKITKLTESYISSSLNNMTTWKHIRLFLVGDSGAGKTSVVRWLKGEKFNPNHMSTDSVEVSTTDANTWQASTFDIKDYMADVMKQKMDAGTNLPLEQQNFANDENVPATAVTNSQEGEKPMEDEAQQQNITSSNGELTPPSNNNDTHWKEPSATKLNTKIVSDITQLIQQNKQLSVSFHVWDFAGQEEYYNTHHFFLSEAAIYLLVIDISKPIDMNQIIFWLDSITFYTLKSPVILVGTHKDCFEVIGTFETIAGKFTTTTSQNTKATNIMTSIQKELKHRRNIRDITVSCKSEYPDKLRKLLNEVAQEVLGQQCPLKWMLFYDALCTAGADNNLAYVDLKHASELALPFKMTSQDVIQALRFYHHLGFILYLDDANLQHFIFTKPQVLIDVFKTVITALGLATKLSHNEMKLLKQEGRLSTSKLNSLWSQYPAEIIPQLRTLLHKFGLAFDDPCSNGINCDLIIPCQVESPEDSKPENQVIKPAVGITCTINTVPPLGFSNRLIARIIELVGGLQFCHLFKGGCTFTLDGMNFRIKTSPGKVAVESSHKNLEHTSSWINTQKILHAIYSTATIHSKAVEITTESYCFLCNKNSVVVDVQTEKIDHTVVATFFYTQFCCTLCRGAPTRSFSQKFRELATREDQWKELCKILDTAPRGGWRDLGGVLGNTVADLDWIQQRAIGLGITSATLLLKEWQHEPNATVDELLKGLRTIKNETAAELIREWLKESGLPTDPIEIITQQYRDKIQQLEAMLKQKDDTVNDLRQKLEQKDTELQSLRTELEAERAKNQS